MVIPLKGFEFPILTVFSREKRKKIHHFSGNVRGDNEDNVRQSRLAMVNFSERVWMGKLCIYW